MSENIYFVYKPYSSNDREHALAIVPIKRRTKKLVYVDHCQATDYRSQIPSETCFFTPEEAIAAEEEKIVRAEQTVARERASFEAMKREVQEITGYE